MALVFVLSGCIFAGCSDENAGWNTPKIVICVIATLFALFIVVGFVCASIEEEVQRKKEQEQQPNAEEQARAAASERQKMSEQQRVLAERENELRRQREQMEAEQREKEEQLCRARASVVNAAMMMSNSTREAGAKVLAQKARESYLFDQSIGEWISVIRIINPDLNGNVEFRWKLSQEMPRSTWVTVHRGHKLVKNDWGTEGELKQHLTPGKCFTFAFTVQDDTRTYGAPLVMEVKVPDIRFWSIQYTAANSSDHQQRYREAISRRLKIAELREEAMKEIKTRTDISEELREWMYSVIDSETAAFQSEA